MNVGKVIQVIGPVVDISFKDGELPALYNAIHIKKTQEGGEDDTITLEVAQHLGDNAVRTMPLANRR